MGNTKGVVLRDNHWLPSHLNDIEAENVIRFRPIRGRLNPGASLDGLVPGEIPGLIGELFEQYPEHEILCLALLYRPGQRSLSLILDPKEDNLAPAYDSVMHDADLPGSSPAVALIEAVRHAISSGEEWENPHLFDVMRDGSFMACQRRSIGSPPFCRERFPGLQYDENWFEPVYRRAMEALGIPH